MLAKGYVALLDGPLIDCYQGKSVLILDKNEVDMGVKRRGLNIRIKGCQHWPQTKSDRGANFQ